MVEHLVFLFDLLQGGVMEEHEDVRRNIAENVSHDICDKKINHSWLKVGEFLHRFVGLLLQIKHGLCVCFLFLHMNIKFWVAVATASTSIQSEQQLL